jgi:hypothetical protein
MKDEDVVDSSVSSNQQLNASQVSKYVLHIKNELPYDDYDLKINKKNDKKFDARVGRV